MSISPARIARIRRDNEYAVRGALNGQTPTVAEILVLIQNNTDLLTEYTNNHRSA